MRFLLDQSSDARLVAYLREIGHDAIRVGREHPHGLPDIEVLRTALRESRILITDDRDFGDLVVRERLPHAGIVYLRLGEYVPLELAIERLKYVLTHFADQLDHLVIVNRHRVRVRRT
jgi:predicted nuclease of predicted toxin-antitoxin system